MHTHAHAHPHTHTPQRSTAQISDLTDQYKRVHPEKGILFEGNGARRYFIHDGCLKTLASKHDHLFPPIVENILCRYKNIFFFAAVFSPASNRSHINNGPVITDHTISIVDCALSMYQTFTL